MAAALSRFKAGFPSKRIGVGGASGVGGRVSVNPWGSRLRCHCSMARTQHPTVHNRPWNWWVTAPSNSYAPSITGFNQREKEKLEKGSERDRQWKGLTPGGGMFHYPYNHQSDCHTSNMRASYSSPRKFMAVWLWDSHHPIKYPWNAEPMWEQWNKHGSRNMD